MMSPVGAVGGMRRITWGCAVYMPRITNRAEALTRHELHAALRAWYVESTERTIGEPGASKGKPWLLIADGDRCYHLNADTTRQAVWALRGERLPGVDQMAALVEDFRRDTGADATLRVEGESRSLPAEASLALFRGAQEALTNIARYAPGAVTAVTVTYQADRTVVTIEDHVSGPQTATLVGAGGGHGLTAMRERAARVGGTARAGPTAGGWLVELEVPPS